MKALALAVCIAAIAFVPVAEAGPDCYSIYNEYDVGPVTIVQRSSCDYEVCFNGRCGGILQ